MSFAPKTTSLQSYGMLLYRAALHPEFFEIEGRFRIDGPHYDFESWTFHGGHVLRFQHDGICVTEVVSDDTDNLPDRGLVASLPCAGEKDHEAEFTERVSFMTSVQTETLSDHLYISTFNEMIEHGRECEGQLIEWSEPGETAPNMSLLDIQRFQDQIHVQSYHLRADCGLVLRSQTIFQINADKS